MYTLEPSYSRRVSLGVLQEDEIRGVEVPDAEKGGPEGTAPYFDPRGHFRGAETGVRLGLSLFVRVSLYRPVRHTRHVPSKKIPLVAFGLHCRPLQH